MTTLFTPLARRRAARRTLTTLATYARTARAQVARFARAGDAGAAHAWLVILLHVEAAARRLVTWARGGAA